MSRKLGLDGWDVAIHVVVTGALAVAMEEMVGGPTSEWMVPLLIGVSGVVFGIRRRWALRRAPPDLVTGELDRARLDDVEDRVLACEQVEARLAELEERLDFAERLLAQPRGVRGEEREVG